MNLTPLLWIVPLVMGGLVAVFFLIWLVVAYRGIGLMSAGRRLTRHQSTD